MLRAILNKSWRQHPTRHQLYGHLPLIIKTIQVRRTRHAGHCWRSKDEFISDVLLWTPHMAKQKQDDQLEHTYSSYVRIQDVTLKTCQKRWMIGRSGERVRDICAGGTTWWGWWEVSSSSSYRAGSTDIPDPLSPLLPIVHRPRQVFRTTSCILTQLLNVRSCWSSCFCAAVCRDP